MIVVENHHWDRQGHAYQIMDKKTNSLHCYFPVFSEYFASNCPYFSILYQGRLIDIYEKSIRDKMNGS